MLRITLLLIALFIVAAPAAAQSTPTEGCAADDYAALLSGAQAALDKPNADLNLVVGDLIDALANQRARCAGLTFEGSSGDVIGPLDLAAGDYVVDVSFGTIGTVTAEGLDESCESEFNLFLLSSFELGGGTDSGIIRLDSDCRVLFDVAIPQTWTLTLNPVN
jgi:hypothetical protein